jgi:hypothetical protein
MKLIKKFDSFLSEKLVAAAEPAPVTTPTPTITPTRPKPSRPGITPTEVPSEEDAPLAVTTPTPTITPTRPKPSRPGITPTEVPSEEDAPLASAQKVIDRFESVYNNASDEDKKEIDSYFEK